MADSWFYMRGPDKHGPVSSTRLKELAGSGQLMPTDLVWREGMEDWKRARKIDGLFDGSAKAMSQPANAPAALTRPPAPPSNLLGSNETPAGYPAPPNNILVSSVESAAGPNGNFNATQPSWRLTSNAPPAAAPVGPYGIVRCPFCQRGMSDDPTLAGQMVLCPHCRRHLTMPSMHAQPLAWTPPPHQTTTTAAASVRRTARKVQQQVALLAGVGIVVASLFAYMVVGVLTPRGGDLEFSNPLKTAAGRNAISADTISDLRWPEIDAIYNLQSLTTELQKKEEWKKYKGKRIKWTGEVREVMETFGLLGLHIRMNATTFTSDLIIRLKKDQRAKGLRLSVGDRVTFVGTLNEWGTIMPITLSDGEIIE